MAYEAEGHRSEATWKQQRDAIADRNADTRRRARAEQKSRDGVNENRLHERAQRERDQLRALNERLEKDRPR